MAQEVPLKAGDTVAVVGKEGYTTVFEENVFAFIPAVGDMTLVEAGTPVPVGTETGRSPRRKRRIRMTRCLARPSAGWDPR